ncbi:MAG: tetratricopeptide repeat protein [Planctomycetes bacterium]|nr:tetratricopeptide repeat protein [Planctomycetota bacterium]
MKASERRQLRHDEFVDTVVSIWARILQWISPRKHWVLVAGLVILVAVVAYGGLNLLQHHRTLDAWDALEKERAKEEGGVGEPDYARLAQSFGNTEAEPWILFYWATRCVQEASEKVGSKERTDLKKAAIQALEKLRARYPSHPMAEPCGLVLARQYADLQEWKKAREIYGRLAQSKSDFLDSFLKQEATFGLAYSLEAQGDIQQARDHYKELAGSETSFWGDQARFRLEQLSASGN